MLSIKYCEYLDMKSFERLAIVCPDKFADILSRDQLMQKIERQQFFSRMSGEGLGHAII